MFRSTMVMLLAVVFLSFTKTGWTDDVKPAAEPFPAGAVRRFGSQWFTHPDYISDFAYSPKGDILATGCGDQLIRLWDARTGTLLRRMAGHLRSIESIAFSRDGKMLASAGRDGMVRLWDVGRGEPLDFAIKTKYSRAVALSPDNTFLAFDDDKTVYVWDIKKNQAVWSWDFRWGPTKLAFSPNGKLLAIGTLNRSDEPIRLMDLTTGKQHVEFPRGQGLFRCMCFFPDGKTLVSGGFLGPPNRNDHGDIIIWDIATGKKQFQINNLGFAVGSVDISKDGKYVLTGSYDGELNLWEKQGSQKLRRLWRQKLGTAQAKFTPDGKHVVASRYQTLRMFDVKTGKEVSMPPRHCLGVHFVDFGPGGKSIISVANTVHIWDARTGKEMHKGKQLIRLLGTAALSRDRKRLVTSDRFSSTTLWDANTAKVIRLIGENYRHAASMAISPDGKQIFATTVTRRSFQRDGELLVRVRNFTGISVWDVKTGKKVDEFAKKCRARFLAIAPDGKRLVGAIKIGAGTLVYDLPTRQIACQLEQPGRYSQGPHQLDFSPDSRMIAGGDWYGNINLWDSTTGKLLTQMKGHFGQVYATTFSPDGKLLATGAEDGTVRLWDVKQRKALCVLDGHEGPVFSVAFSPDSKQLVSGSADATVLLWDVAAALRHGNNTAKLTKHEFAIFWAQLGSYPSEKSHRGMYRLVASPKESVKFIRKALQMPPFKSPPDLDKLLKDLDSNSFRVREKAMATLKKMGRTIAPALRKALAANPPLEVQLRLKQLLAPFERKKRPRRKGAQFRRPTAQEIQRIRAILVLDRINTPEAHEVLASLAGDAKLLQLFDDISPHDYPREAKQVLDKLRP